MLEIADEEQRVGLSPRVDVRVTVDVDPGPQPFVERGRLTQIRLKKATIRTRAELDFVKFLNRSSLKPQRPQILVEALPLHCGTRLSGDASPDRLEVNVVLEQEATDPLELGPVDRQLRVLQLQHVDLFLVDLLVQIPLELGVPKMLYRVRQDHAP